MLTSQIDSPVGLNLCGLWSDCLRKRLNFALPLLAAVLVGTMTPTAKSQEKMLRPLGLDFDALVAEALEKNPELKFYEAELAAAKAGRKTAGTFANPEVSGSVGQKRVSSPGADEGIAWSVTVVQPFEWPGRIGLRKAIANRDIELAQLGFRALKVA